MASIAEKVERMFNVQQQMVRQLDTIEGCICNISYVLGLQLNMDFTCTILAHLPSTPGSLESTSPLAASTPGLFSSANTSTPQQQIPPSPQQKHQKTLHNPRRSCYHSQRYLLSTRALEETQGWGN